MMPVILESPYAPTAHRTEEDNIEYARLCIKDSLDRGEAPFASHLLYPQVLDESDPEERQRGIMAGFTWWLPGVMKIVFYTDHGWSPGMLAARVRAQILRAQIEERTLTPAE